MMRCFLAIGKALFTYDEMEKKDEMVVASLYEADSLVMSSADRKRFTNQAKLSNHLDYMFKKMYVLSVVIKFCARSTFLLTFSVSL